MLKDAELLANIGFDTAENDRGVEPFKVCYESLPLYNFSYFLVFGLLTHSPAGSFILIEAHVVEICILDIETPGLLLFSKGHHLGLSSRRAQPAPEIMGKQPSRKI